ncbi:MAG: capsid protein [Myxococcaceae bacterium]|nr:capsid protein [Myxococcaceae bacterium]
MVNATPSRVGQANATGSNTALFLKLYSGELMTAFETECVFRDKVMRRPISGGLTAQFPIVGRNTAAYHTPGAEILGNTIAQGEVTITVDDTLVSPVFVSEWDEKVNHYEIRSEYAKQSGLALAYQYDRTMAQLGVLAARGASILSAAGEPGGSQLTDAAYATSGAALAAGAFDAAQVLDEKDVTGDRFMFVRPAQYYLMAETTSILNKDWGGSGSFSKAQVGEVAGMKIIKTNHLPSTNVTTGLAKYQGNFTTTQALVMTKAAVGSLELMAPSVRADYDPRRLGTLVVAKMAYGAGILRPACSIELRSA